MKFDRRSCLAGAAAVAFLAPPSRARAQTIRITPEQFGAIGDGRSNDTEAFAMMSAFLTAQKGGEVVLRRTTYLVGLQSASGGDVRADYAFAPMPIMDFSGCSLPLVIRGNGARLLCAPGLRYGTFDSAGQARIHKSPYFQLHERASPYRAMIWVERCSGPVEISDIELDGRSDQLVLGGPFGDVGWQIPASGIQLSNNSGPEYLNRIHTHHHALDGLIIDGLDDIRPQGSRLQEVACEANVRQGCSIVGGRDYEFVRCKFNRSGKGRLTSPPASGLDIEAEDGKRVRNLHFVECEFSDNRNVGLLADSGDSEKAVFDRCRFVGTTGWAAWPRKPHFRFQSCQFAGPVVHAFGDPHADRACQFHDCVFRDDPALSPTGEIFGSANSLPIADLSENANVLFNRCRFELTHQLVLPWSTDAIFVDCVMSQRASKVAYPRGTYLGRNGINGAVDLNGSRFLGDLTVNGSRVPRSSV